MNQYRRTNQISIGYLLTILEQSLHNDSQTLAVDNILQDTMHVILEEIVNKFSAFDFQYIFMMIGVRKQVFEGEITHQYGQILLQIITHRLKSTRNHFIEMVDNLLNGNETFPLIIAISLYFKNTKNSAVKLEKLKQKFTIFEKTIFQFISIGRFDEENAFSQISTFISKKSHQREGLEHWIQFLSNGQQSIVLIFTFRPTGIVPFLDMVFKKKVEDHVRLLCLNEEDKQDKWMDKLESAAISGDWVYVILDIQWIKLLTSFTARFSQISGRCKIWLICPTEMQELIPNEIFPYVSCSSDLVEERETDNYETYLKQLCSSLEGKDLNALFYGVIIKTHFALLSALPKLSSGKISLDEFDLRMIQRLFIESSKKKLTFENIKKVVISAVYSSHINSSLIIEEIDSLFQSNWDKFVKVTKMKELSLDKLSAAEYYNLWFNSLKEHLHSPNLIQDKWATKLHDDVLIRCSCPKMIFSSAKYSDMRFIKEDERLASDLFWTMLLNKASNDYLIELSSLRDRNNDVWNSINTFGCDDSPLCDTVDATWVNVKLGSLKDLFFAASLRCKSFSEDMQELHTVIHCLQIEYALQNIAPIFSIHMTYSTSCISNVELRNLVYHNGKVSSVPIPSIYLSCKTVNSRKCRDYDVCTVQLNSTDANYTSRVISFGKDPLEDYLVAFEVPSSKACIDSADEMGMRMTYQQLNNSTEGVGDDQGGSIIPVIKSYFSISIISTADVYNERSRIVQVFPTLQSTLASSSIGAQFFDLCLDNLLALAIEDISDTLENVLKRSDMHIFIFGGNLRNSKSSGNDFLIWDKMIKIVCGMNIKPLLFIRDNAFLRSIPKAHQALFESSNDLDRKKLKEVKSKIGEISYGIKHYTPCFSHMEDNRVVLNDLDVFGDQLIDEITKWIYLHPKVQTESIPSLEDFPSQKRIIQQIDDFLDLNQSSYNLPKIFCINGEYDGQGKTTILKTIYYKYATKYAVLNNLVDIGYNSTNISVIVQAFYKQLSEILSETNMGLYNTTDQDLWVGYLNLLKRATFLGIKVLIIVDDIDKIQMDESSNASWIPQIKELSSETWKNILFLVSSSSSQVFYRCIQGRETKYIFSSIPRLSQSEGKDFLKLKFPNALESNLLKIGQMKDGDRFMFLNLFSKLILKADSVENGNISGNYPETIKNLFQHFISSIKDRFESDSLRNIFLFFYFARNGVLETEIMNLLKIDQAKWLYYFQILQHLFVRQQSGKLMLFSSYFSEYIKNTYMPDDYIAKRFNDRIANFYWEQCDPSKEDRWDGVNLDRTVDILIHFFASEGPLDTIMRILCSLSFIRTVFKNGLGGHLKSLFSKATKVCVRINDMKSQHMINDFALFIERNFHQLQAFPDLTASIALSLPDRPCAFVKEKAWQYQKKPENSNTAEIICLSSLSSATDTLMMGGHSSKIILMSVLQLKGVGKCCVSVSDDGAVKLWDIDSYILVDSILAAQFSIREISTCAFNLQPTDTVAYCSVMGEISIYSLLSKKMVIRIPGFEFNSSLFFSDDKSGIWLHNPITKAIQFVSFSGLTEKENKTISASRSIPLLQNCERILGKSWDGLKIAIHSKKYNAAVILNAVTMTEICRFKCDNLDEQSFGCFSVCKDMFAALLSDKNIMVWKIDNHSRISYIKANDIQARDLAFSVDESMIYCGSVNGDIFVYNIHTGKMIKKVQTASTGDNLNYICSASSHGKERFFVAAESTLLLCDLKSSVLIKANDQCLQNLHEDSNIILLCCDITLDHETKKYDALSLDIDGHIILWKHKEIAGSLCLDFGFRACAFEPNEAMLFGYSDSYIMVYSLCSKTIVVKRSISRVFSRVWIRHCKSYNVYWLGALSHDELVCWKLIGKDNQWEMIDLFSKTDVSFVPTSPIYTAFERVCIQTGKNVVILNCWTGKEILTDSNNRGSLKDMFLFEKNGKVSVATLLSDSIYVDNIAWSSKAGLKSIETLDSFCMDDRGEYLFYSGKITETEVDHENECMVNVSDGFIHVIGLFPSRRRLCSLPHKGSIIKFWKLSKRLEVVTLTMDNMLRVWKLRDSGSLKPELCCAYPLSRSLSISSLVLSATDSLIYLVSFGQVIVFGYKT